ncbi:hypothetical protein GN958_ATG16571 [Phytophthora infestans]|uniref:Uncharacterized protein n=1 Tax=Phytophthora infestans TaxID=4787 RepID=A0A8S9TZZ2_PHYIN|nr:hypothetical protein GN958_ATG16571 [Phytophthora infestans]
MTPAKKGWQANARPLSSATRAKGGKDVTKKKGRPSKPPHASSLRIDAPAADAATHSSPGPMITKPASAPGQDTSAQDASSGPFDTSTQAPNATLRERKPIDYMFAVQGFAVDDDNDEDYNPERDPADGRDDDLEDIPSTIRTVDQGRHADTSIDRLKDNTDNAKEVNDGEDFDDKRKCDGEQHVTGFEASILRFVQAAREEAEKAAREEAEKAAREEAEKAAREEAEKAAREEAEKEVASSHTAAEDDMKPVSGQGYIKAIDGATEITVENGTADANTAIRDARGTVLHKVNLNETNQELTLHRRARNEYRPDS